MPYTLFQGLSQKISSGNYPKKLTLGDSKLDYPPSAGYRLTSVMGVRLIISDML